MRKKGNAESVNPNNVYYDAEFKAWVKVYPMKMTRAYKKHASSTWRTTTKGK